MKTSNDPATDFLYNHLANRATVDFEEVAEGITLNYDVNSVMAEKQGPNSNYFDWNDWLLYS